MFGFLKQICASTMMLFGCNSSSVNPLECVSMKSQECKVRPESVNVNSNDPVLCLFSIKTSKCSGSCNNINDPYTNLHISDVAKNIIIRVFTLMSRTNEARHVK